MRGVATNDGGSTARDGAVNVVVASACGVASAIKQVGWALWIRRESKANWVNDASEGPCKVAPASVAICAALMATLLCVQFIVDRAAHRFVFTVFAQHKGLVSFHDAVGEVCRTTCTAANGVKLGHIFCGGQ